VAKLQRTQLHIQIRFGYYVTRNVKDWLNYPQDLSTEKSPDELTANLPHGSVAEPKEAPMLGCIENYGREIEWPSLMVRCHRTGRALHTGIETDPIPYSVLPDIVTYSRCPHCGYEHAWRKSEAWLAESEQLYKRRHTVTTD